MTGFPAITTCPSCLGEGGALSIGSPGTFSLAELAWEPSEEWRECGFCRGRGEVEACALCGGPMAVDVEECGFCLSTADRAWDEAA